MNIVSKQGRGGACLAALAVVGVIGCTSGPKAKRLNAPYFAERNESVEIASYFTSMVDNGLLSTMSISDVHFVPNTMELNSAGFERLRRYARLLQTYGGTLHYESDENREPGFAICGWQIGLSQSVR